MADATLTNATDSEITAEIESQYRSRFNPPAGFRLVGDSNDLRELLEDPDYSGVWDGPENSGNGWVVSVAWSNSAGLLFYGDHASKTGRSDDEPFTAAQALEMSAALTALVEQVTA